MKRFSFCLVLLGLVLLTNFQNCFTQNINNYTFSSVNTGSLALDRNGNTVDMSTGTTPMGLSGDDNASAIFSLGIDYFFMGTYYTQFSTSTNGLLRLGNTLSGTTYSIGIAGQVIISAMGGDLDISTTGKIHYKVVGTIPNRCLVVEYLNMGLDFNSATTADGTYQVRLYESTGIVEFVYGSMFRNTSPLNTSSFNTGINSNNTATTLLSVNTATTTTQNTVFTNVYTAGANMTNLHSTTNGSRTVYTFIPVVPAVPTSLSFTAVGALGMTVNWVDNSTNEFNFAVYRSTDGVNYSLVSIVPSSTSAGTGSPYSLPQTGLSPSTTYFYRIFSVSEGAYSGTPLAGSQPTLAGTLCGTYTVGPTGAYTSLTAAFADLALNSLNCPVILELQAAYVSTVETFPLNIPYMFTSAVNTVTVRPELGATNLSITSTATQTLNFNSALVTSFVTFDGRPGGAGIIRELTIQNTSTTGVAAQFTNDAHHNGFNFVKLRGQNTSTTSGVVVFGNSATAAGNSNNTISNSEIFRTAGAQPANLVYSVNGTASSFNNNTITNSLLYDYLQAGVTNVGILLGNGNTGWNITNNSIYQTTTQAYTTANTHSAIQVNNTGGNNFTITGNFIGGNAPNCGGTAWTINGAVANRFIGINISAGTTVASNIHNNTIRNFSLSTTSGATTANGIWCGINVTNGNVNIGTIGTPNTIGSTTATGSIITTSTTLGITVAINNSSSGTINILGNQIGGITANGSSIAVGASICGIQCSNGTLAISNNLIGSSIVPSSLTNSIAAAAGNINGIIVSGSAISANINGNSMGSFVNQNAGGQVRGIATSTGINTITANTIAGIGGGMTQTGTGTSACVIGISQSSTTAGQTISLNTISGIGTALTSGNTMITGIEYSGPTSGTNLISQNIISGIGAQSNTASPVINGIRIDGGIATYANNMILLGVDPAGAALTNSHEYNGIYKNTGSNNNFFFNTISISGTGVGAGALNTFAFRRNTTGTDVVRNNIFSNTRSNGASTGTHYSIFINNNTTLTSNNNDLFGNGTGYVLGNAAAVNYPTLAAWQGATTLDANSISSIAPFVSATDLHINGLDPNAAFLDGTAALGTGITVDIDATTRSVTGPDMGADEFTGPICVAANGGTITPSTYTRCANQTVVLTSTGFTTGTGLTYQWRISTTPGGPYSNVVGGTGATTATYTSGALVAGTYYYVLQTTCSAGPTTGLSNEVTVTVNPLPAVAVSPTSAVICLPGGAAIPLTASGATTYTWLPTAGLTPATGANVSALPAATTTYTVTGTDGVGCTNTATTVITLTETPPISSISATPSSVCSGGNSQLLVTANLTGLAGYTNTSVPFVPINSGSGTIVLASGGVAVTTMTSTNLDDGYWNGIAMPFSFSYFGTSYNTINVQTNGIVSFTPFGVTQGYGASPQIPNATAPNNIIAPCFGDLNWALGGVISCYTSGVAPNRIFVINYNGTTGGGFYNGVGVPPTALVTTQVQLFETSNIIQFHTTSINGPTTVVHTQGVENAAGTLGTVTPGRDNTATWTATNDGQQFAPSGNSLTYSWSPATFLSSTTINNPMANAVTSTTTYTVTVTNGGCNSTASTTITAGAALTSTAITTNSPVCQGSDIIATAHPSGGGTPYTYSWDINGGTPFTSPTATVNIPGLAPATYTLNSLVTDACGATTPQSISITVNPTPTASASSNSPLCVGNTINLSGSTNIGTSFNWTGPNAFSSTTQSPSIASSTTAMSGTYSFTATLGTCTSAVATTVVAVNANPAGVTASSTSGTICTGATVNLSSSAVQSGNILVENFNAGAPTWTRINNSFLGTPALAAWTDRPNGYTYVSSPSVTFNSNDNSQFVLTNADPQGSGSTTITFLQSPSFSTVGYSACNLSFYHSYRDVSATQPNDSATVQISTDGVTWNNLQMFNSDQPVTFGQFALVNINLNAYIGNPNVRIRFNYFSTWDWWWAIDNVTVSGTASPVTFAWTSAPAGFTSAVQNPTGVAPTASTVYTVTATNGFGCTATANTSVTVNSLPTVNYTITPNDTVCAGSSVTLSGTGATSYSWTGGITNAVAFTPASTTTYTVTGTDVNTCTNTASVQVVVNTTPTVSYTASPNDTVCAGNNLTLSGTGANTYTWTGGITNAVAFIPASSTTYTVTGTAANGCTNTASAPIVVNTLPTVSFTASPNDTVCIGSNVTLSGTGASSYTWTGGISNAVAFTPALGSTTYTVTGTNGAGCTNTASATIFVNSLPNVSYTVSPNDTVCAGGNVTLSGTGANTYTWTGGITNAVAFTPASSLTYTVTGTATNGCTKTASAPIVVNTLPTVSYTASPNDTICFGNNLTLSGTGAASYTWTGGITNAVAFTPASSLTYTVTGTAANGCTNTASAPIVVTTIPTVSFTASPNDTVCLGSNVTLSGTGAASYTWTGGISNAVAFTPALGSTTYTVTGTNGGGCTNTASATIFVNNLPNVSYTVSPNDTVCAGSNVTLSGTGANTYTWTGGITNAVAFIPASSLTYTVTGTATNGCTKTASAPIVVNTLPTVSYTASPNDTVCAGNNLTLSGTGAASYTWTGGITNAVAFTPASSLTYTVTGTAANGCTNTASAPIVVNTGATVSYTATPNDTVCPGGTVTLNGTGAAFYTWTGGISDGVAFTPVGSLTYTVTGTDAFGCTGTASAPIVMGTIPTVNLGPDVIQPNPPAILDAGPGFSSYVWSPSGNTQTISVNTNGQYIVTVTNIFGCSNSDTIQVNFTSGVINIDGTTTIMSLYPNPTSGPFNVKIDNLETTNLVIDILDLTGRIVYNRYIGSVSGNVIEAFDMTDLRMGTYVLRMTANGKSTQLRFIIGQ